MAIRSCLAGIFILLAVLPCFSQRKVQGRVVDAATSAPLPGVTVKMRKVDFQTTSGTDGTFELFFPNAGEMRYAVEMEGYRTVKIKPEEGENRTIALEKKEAKQPDTLPPPLPLPARYGSEAHIAPDSLQMLGIQHTAQFLQGQVAGLIVQRPGGNPNEDFLLRLRGLSTFTAQTSPLIVVDGLPESSLYLLDPNDIASVRVLKDAAAAAKYGIRGASGVIEVETKKAAPGQLMVRYHGFAGQDFVGRRIPVASPEEFVGNNGTDFRERTDWASEITRTPVSHGHHLSLSGGAGEMFGYAATFGYRNTEGILKNSGFEQLNGRLRLQFEPWKDRLSFHAQVFGTDRKSMYSFPEAFTAAIKFNPTAPVRSDATIFQPFGGYFETQVFLSQNPVSIVEQNVNIGTWQQYGGRAGVDFSLLKNLKISAFYARQEHERLGGRYISPRSLFENGIMREGALRQFVDDRTNEFAEAVLSGTFDLKNIGLKINHRHGMDLQRHGYEFTAWGAERTRLVELTYDNLEINLTGQPSIARFQGARNIRAYFTDWQADGRHFFIGANLRYEGSNFQEKDFKYGLFYGLTGGLKVSEWLAAENYNAVVRVGYGKTGGLFAAVNPNISIPAFFSAGQPAQAGGEFLPGLTFFGNPNFQWEDNREWNLGADFSTGWAGLHASLDFYKNTADGLMTIEPLEINGVLLGHTPFNTGKLTNTGLELTLSADLVNKPRFSWQTRFNFFTNTTTVKKFSRTETERDSWFFSGFSLVGGLPPRNLLKEGERLGQIHGAVFQSVGAGGIPVIEDLNQDGFTDEFEDAKVIGQAMPRFGIGWQHMLTRGKFDLVLNFRGLFGHYLANSYRQARENVGSTTLNFVKTDEFIPGQLFSGGFNDRYVEKASFLKLDYFALGYHIPVKKGTCRLYVAGQNLLTLTRYTGADPEPRLETAGNPLILGIEDGRTYYRNQSLTGGVQVSF